MGNQQLLNIKERYKKLISKYLDIEYWKNNVNELCIENLLVYINYINNISYSNVEDEYFEIHHIIPASIKPELKKDENNLVKIKASDHFALHRILKDCFVGKSKSKMEYAFNLMCYSKPHDKYNVTNEDYAEAKKSKSILSLGDNNPAKRKDVQKKMSENHYDISGDNNPMKKRGGWSQEEKDNLSKHRIENKIASGENNPMYGKRGEENPNFGRIAIHKNGVGKRVYKSDLDKYLSDDWEIGALPKKKSSKKGYVWVSLNEESHLVSPNEVQDYLDKGFKLKRNI